MNKLDNRQKVRRNIVRTFAALCVGLLSIGFTACDDDLDVTQAYPFTVETMPVPKELAQGETAEIRCELVREGEFDGAVYTIRYFQYDGEGTLKLDNGLVLQPNDRYLLENEKFRLYYTSECDESQSLTITVEDNFGNAFEWEVEFNNGSDADVALTAGYDVRHGLIGAGVYASHGYERSHKDGVKNTFELLKAYLG